MHSSSLVTAARLIVARNLTPNVAGVSVTFDGKCGHMVVSYYLHGPATDDDEEWRELTVGELAGEFPEIRTASSSFGSAEEMKDKEPETLVFVRA